MSSIRFNDFYGKLFHQHNIIIYNNYIDIVTIYYNNDYGSGCVAARSLWFLFFYIVILQWRSLVCFVTNETMSYRY